MESIVLIFMELVGVFILSLLIAGIWGNARRRKRARERWRKTSGCITEFGLTGSAPEVSYTYTVEGVEYNGSAMVPDKLTSKAKGIPLKKNLYVDDYGRLRFPPRKRVEVYYDPSLPEDSALTLASHRGALVPVVIMALFCSGLLAFILHQYGVLSIANHLKAMIGPTLVLFVGMVLLASALRFLWLHLRSRDFSSVEGELLEARAEKDGKHTRLGVKYEYEVEGVRYFSRQIWATGVIVGSSNVSSIEAEAKTLLENPKVRIWYDPQAPWRCYLRQGPVSMIFFLFIGAAVFGGIGGKILMSLLGRL